MQDRKKKAPLPVSGKCGARQQKGTKMSTLPITARRFKELVTPVLSCASSDMQLPVLNTVRVETRGRWLVALATDRFRVGIHRIERPEGCPDEWSATIPLGAVKGIVSTFTPRRGMDVDLTLTIEGANLTAAAAGSMVGGFFDASFRWPLETGEFPKVWKLVDEALRDRKSAPSTKVRLDFFSDFKSADPHGQGLWVRATGKGDPNRNPVVVTDGENFVGLVMPRRGAAEFPEMADWSEVFAVETAAIKAAS